MAHVPNAPATRSPLLLTGPYLAMWLWLIVPFTLHGLVPLGILPKVHVSLHLGGWIEDIDRARDLSDALRIMRIDRAYSQCRYLRLGVETTALIALAPNQQHSSFFRLTQRGTGHVMYSISNAAIIENIRRNLK